MRLIPFLALLTATAFAVPNPDFSHLKARDAPADELEKNWCHIDGQPCSKLKRATDAAAAALAEPISSPSSDADLDQRLCHLPGQKCDAAKRSASALAEAVAKASAIASPDAEAEAFRFNRFCHISGQGCSKVKRAASAIAEALAEPDAGADASAHPEAFRFLHWCHGPGQGCSKAKRAANELIEAAHQAVEGLGLADEVNTKTPARQHNDDDVNSSSNTKRIAPSINFFKRAIALFE